MLSKYSRCNSKKSKFIIEKEAKRIIGNLLRAKIPILGDIPLLGTLF